MIIKTLVLISLIAAIFYGVYKLLIIMIEMISLTQFDDEQLGFEFPDEEADYH